MVRAFILRRMGARATEETRWIGDKTPAYVKQLGRLHHLFPQAKILHMVRDPRDVAVSRLGFEARAGAGPRAGAGRRGSPQGRRGGDRLVEGRHHRGWTPSPRLIRASCTR